MGIILLTYPLMGFFLHYSNIHVNLRKRISLVHYSFSSNYRMSRNARN